MAEQRREILGTGEGIPLSPAVNASLTVSLEEKSPKAARFELIREQSDDVDITNFQAETADGVANRTITESNSGKFHEDFLMFMAGQGYRLTPADKPINPHALFSDDVDISGKSLRDVQKAFNHGLMEAKRITSQAIYRAVGPDAPNSSKGNVR
jgi:hypothetical protein